MGRLKTHRGGVLVLLLLAVVVATLVAVTGRAASDHDPFTAGSPDGALTATLREHGGALALTVRRAGRDVLTADVGSGHLRNARASQAAVEDAYTTPAGKRLRHELDATRLSVAFPSGRRLEVMVADDGVAYRLAGDADKGSSWRAPAGTRAWLQSYGPEYENRYEPVDLRSASAGDYGFPALLDTGRGNWALLTESGLTREPAARLTVADQRPGELAVTLPSGETAPGTTPWRVAIVGGLDTIVDSDLAESLGRPSQIHDTSWIRPGRAAWSWWSEPDTVGDQKRQEAYLRAAAAHRWEYVLLDAGWWNLASIPDLARTAARGGQRLVLWTDWKALSDPAERRRLFAQWASWGVAGVKVDFLLSDSAARMAIYEDIARDAAARKLVVAFHGNTIPRGIQRTWPNVLTLEAVRGTEYEGPVGRYETIDPRHDVNLVFTRNVVGSMDYTPVTFSAANRDTTDAHRLALAVAFESGLQHFADSPEAYAKHPQATKVLDDVPTAWDDTRLLAGEPDREAIVARRSGEAWWIGSISATDAHRQEIGLGFLDPGRTYNLHLVRDDGRGGLTTEDRVVTGTERLAVDVDRHGGFVAELTPR